MSLNTLNVGKLKFIVASLKGLSATELGIELDRICVGFVLFNNVQADQDPVSFYNCFVCRFLFFFIA